MTYRRYSLILCVVVFIFLTAVFSVFLYYTAKLKIKTINGGGEDEKILKDYRKKQRKTKGKKHKKATKLGKTFSVFFSLLFCGFFALAFSLGLAQNGTQRNMPLFRVVNSASMSYKHRRNEYLFKNELNNQFNTYDLIVTHKLPSEYDLKIYDVVVYEVDDTLVVHRIVGIEEPNAKHPNERWFTLQGDAVQNADRFPVLYSQMRAIYYGKRVPFAGSFISFLQSPAGYLCLLLFLVEIIVEPIVNKRIQKAISARLAFLLAKRKSGTSLCNKQIPPFIVLSPQYPEYVPCKNCQPSSCNKPCPYRFQSVKPTYPFSFADDGKTNER